MRPSMSISHVEPRVAYVGRDAGQSKAAQSRRRRNDMQAGRASAEGLLEKAGPTQGLRAHERAQKALDLLCVPHRL